MKKILLILLSAISLLSCGSPSSDHPQISTPSTQKNYVEVLYFHGKQRCITCNAIEALTKDVLQTSFAKQLKEGTLIFKVIDISTKEGETLADKYEVTWSSLYINQWKESKETRNNLTDFGFSYAKGSPEVFKAGVKKKIDELLK